MPTWPTSIRVQLLTLLWFYAKTKIWKVPSCAGTYYDYCGCLDVWPGGAKHLVIGLGLTLTLYKPHHPFSFMFFFFLSSHFVLYLRHNSCQATYLIFVSRIKTSLPFDHKNLQAKFKTKFLPHVIMLQSVNKIKLFHAKPSSSHASTPCTTSCQDPSQHL